MAWQFLRRVVKLMGGKLMGKIAPRLVFFQYTDLVNNELDNKKRNYRMMYQIKSSSELLISELRLKKNLISPGLSQVRQNLIQGQDQANILRLYQRNEFFQADTVFSQTDDLEKSSICQLIELDSSIVRCI